MPLPKQCFCIWCLHTWLGEDKFLLSNSRRLFLTLRGHWFLFLPLKVRGLKKHDFNCSNVVHTQKENILKKKAHKIRCIWLKPDHSISHDKFMHKILISNNYKPFILRYHVCSAILSQGSKLTSVQQYLKDWTTYNHV